MRKEKNEKSRDVHKSDLKKLEKKIEKKDKKEDDKTYMRKHKCK
jgi:hypothetical protein